MHFDKFSFGTLRIDGNTYEQDRGDRPRRTPQTQEGSSRKFRDTFGHTPLSVEEKYPGNATGL
jgi:hypothetical protein